MTNVVTCIDHFNVSAAVCDAGAWASLRLNAPLKLLHVLDKSEYPIKGDLSGSIGLGSQEYLLDELTALEEKRSKLAMKHGKYMLEAAERRVREDGAKDISTFQRHGSLVETLMDIENETRLLVMGRRGRAKNDVTAHSIGSHLENVIRTVHKPILIALEKFSPPGCFMIAFDGSPTAQKALDMVAGSPLLKGLPCHLVMVCSNADERKAQLDAAFGKLVSAGFDVTQKTLEGKVLMALNTYQKEKQIELMVMGAYGHSRIRQFLVGSNTTSMLRMSNIPLLLLR